MRISDWSSDVCSSDLVEQGLLEAWGVYGAPWCWQISIPKMSRGQIDYPARAGLGGYRHEPADPKTSITEETTQWPSRRALPKCSARSEEHTSELQSLMRTS